MALSPRLLGCSGLREKKFQKKKATIPLHLLLSALKRFVKLKLHGHRHTTVPDDINEKNVMRGGGVAVLKLLLTLKGLPQQLLECCRVAFFFRCYSLPLGTGNNTEEGVCSKVVVCAACTLTTTSMLWAECCVLGVA